MEQDVFMDLHYYYIMELKHFFYGKFTLYFNLYYHYLTVLITYFRDLPGINPCKTCIYSIIV
jgi:hypothetical protein